MHVLDVSHSILQIQRDPVLHPPSRLGAEPFMHPLLLLPLGISVSASEITACFTLFNICENGTVCIEFFGLVAS